MINQSLRRWLPVLAGVFASMFLVAWAVDQESHIQGSVFLPGGFSFQAYLPGRYTIYCDMDLKPNAEYMRVANIKALPRVVCDIRGAGHLSVLNVPVWHSGGLNRYIKSAYGDNTTRLLVPFAEFDILWPGTYEVRATFTGQGSGYFLMSLGPTSVVLSALLISILALLSLFFFSFHKKKEIAIEQKVKPKSTFTQVAEGTVKENIETSASDLGIAGSVIENAQPGGAEIVQGEVVKHE